MHSGTALHYPAAKLEPPGIEDLRRFASRFCLVGHTHLPLVCAAADDRAGAATLQVSRPPANETRRLEAERAIVNVGSVGRSFVDPLLARYLLIDTHGRDDAPALTFRSVPYAVQRLLGKLEVCGVPPELAAELQTAFEGPTPVRERVLASHRSWYPKMAHGEIGR
jgi:diadenosine tetraphosphatase ApaH/serine/threonine PP2A family protein phosphatase